MPPQFKFASVLVVWAVVAIVLLSMIGTGFQWIFGAVLVACATAVTLSIVEGEKERQPKVSSNDKASSKAKRDEGNLAEMLSLLDEQDAYDVRQRIKQRLLDQIDDGVLDNVESFEQLLSSSEKRRKG